MHGGRQLVYGNYVRRTWVCGQDLGCCSKISCILFSEPKFIFLLFLGKSIAPLIQTPAILFGGPNWWKPNSPASLTDICYDLMDDSSFNFWTRIVFIFPQIFDIIDYFS